MSAEFHVLASGSSGNASVLSVNGVGLLLDFGLPLRQLTSRMKLAGISWDHIQAAILTHTHNDHWQASTLSQLAKQRLPVYCHADHLDELAPQSRAFAALSAAELFRFYVPGIPLRVFDDWVCTPIALSHDAPATCGFRMEGDGWAIGYAADLGSWKPALAKKLADVDVLALEFNHDVAMQIQSGRHPKLIHRVLGDHGHLSNDQAADLLTEVIAHSEPGRLQHVVQLHLSRECNSPAKAREAARRTLARMRLKVPVHTVGHGELGPTIRLGAPSKNESFTQPHFPFAAGS